jgi:hypothetical protein
VLGDAISQLHATQKLTYEQLKEFWDQHQTLRQATGTAFEESTSRQEQLYQELLKQKEEMAAHSRQLELATLRIQEQHELLRQTSQVVGEQRTELKEVREAVLSPRGKARWGWFAGPSDTPARPPGESEGMAALLGGGGLPVGANASATVSGGAGAASGGNGAKVAGVNFANASKYPAQEGLDRTFVAHGSTLYFKLKFTAVISGPYGPVQKLLSLPINPYTALPTFGAA